MGASPLICGVGKAVEPERLGKVSFSAKDRCYGERNGSEKLSDLHRAAAERNSGGNLKQGAWSHCEGLEERSRLQQRERKGPPRHGGRENAAPLFFTTSKSVNSSDALSKYEVQLVLGKGRYSQVLQVQCRHTGLQFALKTAQKRPTMISDEGSDYKREIEVLRLCQHPCIVTLHHVLETRDKAYLFLELATGGSLFDRISAHGHFDEGRGRKVLRMILKGVSYLHDNGITHRDVKLENILFKSEREDSQVVITDFGLAHIQQQTSHGGGGGGGEIVQTPSSRNRTAECMSTTCGTAEYMSPEMLEGEEYGQKVDVWAVGVVVYAVLSGEMPFLESPERGGRARFYQDIKGGQYSLSAEVGK